MKFEFFIASRYLRAKRKQAVIGVITVISIAGVTAGVASLVIALAINNGFRQDLQDRLLGSTSHVNLMRTMEQYLLVLVKRGTGENRSEMEELLSSGELAVGGEIHDPHDLAAVTIYPAGSEQAKKLTDAHRSARSQTILIEIHPWITAKGVLKPGQPFEM